MLICFFLALAGLLAITFIDIASSSHQLENNIKEKCKLLQSFVISQVLIKNEDAIQPKLDAVSQSAIGKFTWSTKTFPTHKAHLYWNFPFSWAFYYPVKSIDGNDLGTFIVTGYLFEDPIIFNDFLQKISLLFLFFTVILIVLYPLGRRIPEQLFLSPVNNLLLLLRNQKKQSIEDKLLNFPEEITEIKNKISVLLKDAEERSHEAALGQIAMQVAHDIRSPLLVLNLEISNLPSISESKRIAIREATQRVNDIANNLLSEYKKNKSTDGTNLYPEPVAVMLASIVSEKRVQTSNTAIKIELIIQDNAGSLFANVDISGFKRVLSNLINNSIEALNNNGLIIVKLNKCNEKIIVSIIDDGCGIPKDKLDLALQPGISLGKSQGFGLGLPYVINKIQSWNGSYAIDTEENKGTIFKIFLSSVTPPKWFASHLYLPQNGTIVILDDDPLMHEAWKNRFSNDLIQENKLTLIHLYTPKELVDYIRHFPSIFTTVFFLDYELVGHEKTGLKLAEELNIIDKSILITSRHEDINIKKTCQQIKLKLLPKSFILNAPLKIIHDTDLIFIDDDETITTIWKERALLSNKRIEIFNDIDDFIDIFHFYEKHTPIYIDSELGKEKKGEEFAKMLYEHGYENLFLTTGHEKINFNKVYWVKDIMDKYPPF